MKLRRVFDKRKNIKIEDTTRKDKKTNTKTKTKCSIEIKNSRVTHKITEREGEHEIISEQVKNFITYKNGTILYISGVPGSGKTFLVTTILDQLYNPDINVSFINCTALTQKTQIYKEILKTFNKRCNVNVHASGLQELRRHFSETKSKSKNKSDNSDTSCPHIIVLDEIDFLMNKNEKVLYNLFDLTLLSNASVMMILLSNTLGKLSTKVESRIGNNRIEFKPYTAEQLERILEAKEDLHTTKTTNTSLHNKFIAKKVASGTGDFRKAMELVSKNAKDIQELNQHIKDYYKSIIKVFYNELNMYQKAVIEVINSYDSTKIDLLNLYDTFKTHCRVNSTPFLDYFAFVDVVEDLRDFGFIKVTNREIRVNYIKEELL